MSKKENAITVSHLNEYIKSKFSDDSNLKNIVIIGEVSNFIDHKKSGCYFFSLKDDKCSVKATMWKSNVSKVKFKIQNGMNLIITGSVAVFPRDGIYQIYCNTIEPDGIGSLTIAFEQLKEKLYKMNYFAEENKKQLPPLPKTIGLVTSPNGAALQDILNILERRYPLGEVILFPTLVQGESSAKSIVENIQKAETYGGIDVLIVGRGGGSYEDLWSFNEEIVAEAIYNCTIPIISAVGHESDFTISDLVADKRAPTPSAAAEIVATDVVSLKSKITKLEHDLDTLMKVQLDKFENSTLNLSARLKSNSPSEKLEFVDKEFETLAMRLDSAIINLIKSKRQRMMSAIKTMEALSPLNVLTRGYSITYDEHNNIITNASQVNSGDTLITKFADSEIKSVVE